MLSSMYRDGMAKMFHSAIDTENKIGGLIVGAMWRQNVEHEPRVKAFSNASLKLPLESLDAGDEVVVALYPPGQSLAGEQPDQPRKQRRLRMRKTLCCE